MKTTQRELKRLVRAGIAQDITNGGEVVTEQLEKIAYSCGIYGVNGALLRGRESGTLYAITARTTGVIPLRLINKRTAVEVKSLARGCKFPQRHKEQKNKVYIFGAPDA